MPSADDVQFGRLALAHSLVTREELTAALREQERQRVEEGQAHRLGDILVSMELATRAQVDQILAEQSGRQTTRLMGGFELLERIGSGGMGTVYRARQTALNRIVALKVLPQRLAADADFLARFHREARAVARLSHPNIVSGIDVGEADGYHYLAMEYVDGTSAAELLQQHPSGAPADRLIEIARQIARALDHAHRNGIIHRDIKPENILISREGTAKLCDLGLARTAGGDDAALTQAGMAVGTPHYISPEQARGRQDIDQRADLYSLGATLFHLATGRPLFTGDNAQQVMTKHIEEPAPAVTDLAPSVPAGLAAVIARTLAKRREDRYASAAELIEDLDLVADGQPPRHAPPVGGRARAPFRPPTRHISTATLRAVLARRRRPYQLMLGIAASALIALAGGSVFWALRGRPRNGHGPVPPATGPQTEPVAGPGPGSDPQHPTRNPSAATAAREAGLRRLLEDAERFAEANPGDFRGRADRFDAVARECPPGSPTRRSAVRQADQAREDLTAAVSAAFGRVRERTAAMISGRRFGEALALLASPPADLPWREEPAMAELAAAEAARIREAALAEWSRIERDCDARTAARKFPEALAALEPVKAFGLPELNARAEAKAHAVGEARSRAAMEERARAEKAYREFLPAFRRLVGTRRYRQAGEQLDQTARGLPADLAARLEEERRDLETVRGVHEAAVRRIAGAGTTTLLVLRLRDGQNVSGKFARFDERSGTVWLRVASPGGYAEKDVPLERLSAGGVLELAGLTTTPDATREQVRRAMVFTARDDATTVDEAREAIGAARLKGLSVARYERRIGEISQTELDRAAEARLGHLRELAGREQWDQAHATAEELLGRNYENAEAVVRHGAEIAGIMARAAGHISARTRRTLLLQRGRPVPELGIAYYSGCADTCILAPPATPASMGGADRLTVCGQAAERTLVRFDLGAVPARVSLESARLEMFCLDAAQRQAGSKLRALRLAAGWEEGVRPHALGENIDGATWTNRRASGGGAAWASPGGDIDAAHDSGLGPGVAAEADDPAAGQWVRLDVTAAVRSMLAAGDRNFGFLLCGRSAVPGSSTRWTFASAESMDDRLGLRPRLVLQLTGLSFAPGPEPVAAAEQVHAFASDAAYAAFQREFDVASWPDGKSLRDTTRLQEGALRIGRPRGAIGLLAKRQWGADLEVRVRLRLGVPAVAAFVFDPALPDSGATALRFLHYPGTSSVSGQLATAIDRSSQVPGTLGLMAASSDPQPRRGYFSKTGSYELRAVKEGRRLRLFCGGNCLAEAGLSARDAQAAAAARVRLVLVPLAAEPPMTVSVREVRIGPPATGTDAAGPTPEGGR